MTASSFIRHLDRDELLMHLIHDRMGGYANCAWINTLEGECDLQRLSEAVNQLMPYTPMLNVVIGGDQDAYFAKPSQAIEPDIRSFTREHADSWQAIAEDQINELFQSEAGPLWRLVVVHAHGDIAWELMFVSHHSISDGFSATRFLHQLIQTYAQGVVDVPTLQSSGAFPAPVDDFLPASQKGFWGYLSLAAYLFRAIVKALQLQPEKLPLKGDPQHNRSGLIHARLSAQKLNKLKQQAKNKGANLHGALLAAQMLAAKPFLIHTKPTMGAVTTVNLRPRLSADAEKDLALRVGTLFHCEKLDNDIEFWQLAQQLHDDVKTQIQRGHDQSVGRIALWQVKQMIKKYSAAMNLVQLANVGVSQVADEYPGLKVTAAHGVQNFNGLEGVLTSLVITHQGSLMWNLSFVEPQFTRAQAQTYLDNVFKQIDLALV